MTKFREGSMGAADQKTLKTAKIIMAIVSVIFILLTFAGLFHTYLHMWMKKAGTAANVFGFIFFLASFAPLAFQARITDKTQKEGLFYIIWFICILLGVVVSCGFNFTL